VTLGTTYREPGPFGVRHGTVTEFEQPTKITFHQPMAMALHSGTIDVTVRYTLVPKVESTHVQRVVTLGIPWPLKLLQSLLVPIWPSNGAPYSRSRPTLRRRPSQAPRAPPGGMYYSPQLLFLSR
jgi:hypothetical protein